MIRSKRAQTIMELTIAVGILVVVAGLATMITARVYKSYEVIKAENEARKTVEEALHTIAYGYDQGLIDATGITVINPDSAGIGDEITFTAQDTTAIRYHLTGQKINKQEGGVDSEDLYISDDVAITNFQLVYLNNIGTAATDTNGITASDITRVKITIVAWVYVGADYRELTVHTSIRPLNLYNL